MIIFAGDLCANADQAVADRLVASDSAVGWRLDVSSDRKTYKATQEIVIKVDLLNTAREEQAIWRGPFFASYALTVFRDGEEVLLSRIKVAFGMDGSSWLNRIKSDAVVENSVSLNEFLDKGQLLAPGSYTVKIRRDMRGSLNRETPPVIGKDVLEATVQFTIIE